jgi:hypothetical protein
LAEFAKRRCHIQGPGDTEHSELVISFFPPEEKGVDSGDWWASAELDCKYFTKRLDVGGGDGVHALLILLNVVHAFLYGREVHQGYSIYWMKSGDLADLPYWGANPTVT